MALLDLVNLLFRLAYLAVLVRVILSWIPGAYDHPVAVTIVRLTDPILAPIRRLLPPVGGLDLSPFVAILVLEVLRNVVFDLLRALLF